MQIEVRKYPTAKEIRYQMSRRPIEFLKEEGLWIGDGQPIIDAFLEYYTLGCSVKYSIALMERFIHNEHPELIKYLPEAKKAIDAWKYRTMIKKYGIPKQVYIDSGNR